MSNMPYERITFNLAAGCRTDYLDGREYAVAPATIMAEGVWAGSAGPLYYPATELERWASTWNHKPVVLYHPEKDGQPISACNPTILNSRGIGVLLNTVYKDSAWKTEVWLDVNKTKVVDKRVIESLKKGDRVEVSTGLQLDSDGAAGTFNNKQYNGTTRNYRPDHLAVLPDKVGAFSVADGGGLLANAYKEPEGVRIVLERAALNTLASVGAEIKGNELSFSDTSRQISELLSRKYGKPGEYWEGWIIEVFSDRVIFNNEGKFYQIDYSVKDDVVTLSGDAKEVERVVEYRAVNAQNEPRKGQEDSMAFNKKAHIDALIANGNPWTEQDRAGLEGMPDAQLEKLKPTPTPAPAPTPANNTTPAPTATVSQYIANAPPELRDALQDMVQTANQERDRLVKDILAYPQNPWKEEQLRATPINNLRNLHSMIPRQPTLQDHFAPLIGQGSQSVPSYVGAAGAPAVQNNAPTDFLALPEITFGPAK